MLCVFGYASWVLLFDSSEGLVVGSIEGEACAPTKYNYSRLYVRHVVC